MAVDFFGLKGPFAVVFRGEGAAAHVMQTPQDVFDLLWREDGAGFCHDSTEDQLREWLADEDMWNTDEDDDPFEWRCDIGEISCVSVDCLSPAPTSASNKKVASSREFHRLWSDCVGKPGYCKTDWRAVELQLLNADVIE